MSGAPAEDWANIREWIGRRAIEAATFNAVEAHSMLQRVQQLTHRPVELHGSGYHRRAGKHAADHVPAFLAAQVGLVPGHGAVPGLVRIDHQHGTAVGTAARSHGEGVGAFDLA